MSLKRTYTKINQAYNWSPFLEELESFPEFVIQKELTEKKWPIPRLQSIIKPFQIGVYHVYKKEELKKALEEDLKNPSTFVLHPDYIDLNEIGTMLLQSPARSEIILNFYNQYPIFVHPELHSLKIYDRVKLTKWFESNKYHIEKNIPHIKGLQISSARFDDPHLSEDLKKYKFTGSRAALYLGQTQSWMCQNRSEPLHRRIPFIRIGKLYRYAQEDLDFYIRSHIKPGATMLRKSLPQ